jgi:hypothetical protein
MFLPADQVTRCIFFFEKNILRIFFNPAYAGPKKSEAFTALRSSYPGKSVSGV